MAKKDLLSYGMFKAVSSFEVSLGPKLIAKHRLQSHLVAEMIFLLGLPQMAMDVLRSPHHSNYFDSIVDMLPQITKPSSAFISDLLTELLYYCIYTRRGYSSRFVASVFENPVHANLIFHKKFLLECFALLLTYSTTEQNLESVIPLLNIRSLGNLSYFIDLLDVLNVDYEAEGCFVPSRAFLQSLTVITCSEDLSNLFCVGKVLVELIDRKVCVYKSDIAEFISALLAELKKLDDEFLQKHQIVILEFLVCLCRATPSLLLGDEVEEAANFLKKSVQIDSKNILMFKLLFPNDVGSIRNYGVGKLTSKIGSMREEDLTPELALLPVFEVFQLSCLTLVQSQKVWANTQSEALLKSIEEAFDRLFDLKPNADSRFLLRVFLRRMFSFKSQCRQLNLS